MSSKLKVEEKMNNTIRKAAIIVSVASCVTGFVIGTSMLENYVENREQQEHQRVMRENFLPKPTENQQLILHPEYLRGHISKGYVLLTDIDFDGSWDCAEKYHAGFTTGDGYRQLYFKKGFGPARNPSQEVELHFVDKEFFQPYE